MPYERPIVVFAYDFDGTLAPGYMQNHAFIPDELAMDHAEFWAEVRTLAQRQRGDEIHAYMHLMLRKAKDRGLELSLESWRRRGEILQLFSGVEEWFPRMNALAERLEVDLRHFIISSGNREIIEGSKIAHNFEKIYASAFMFDEKNDAVGAALGINYTNKTQYLFRINKWTLEEWDNESINRAQKREDRPVPFDRIVYFGDGDTDVPSMRLVTDQGGYAVAIYKPGDKKSEQAALNLKDDGRAHFAGPGDYTKEGPLDKMCSAILTEIAARYHARNLVKWPELA
jgi:phosphoserine phosphatase